MLIYKFIKLSHEYKREKFTKIAIASRDIVCQVTEPDILEKIAG